MSNTKQTIHNLLETIPDTNLPEIINFIMYIKMRDENKLHHDEDFHLAIEAESRIKDGEPYISHNELMDNLGITEADIIMAEDVEIE